MIASAVAAASQIYEEIANRKILYLPVNKVWYDMIFSGEKPEEYRELKPYWVRRFIDISRYPSEEKNDTKNIPEDVLYDIQWNKAVWPDILKGYYCDAIDFTHVCFRNGYSRNARTMLVECKGISIGKCKPKWSGSMSGDHFIISLGKIIKHNHDEVLKAVVHQHV